MTVLRILGGFLVLPVALLAQSERGNIGGIVTDPAGAAIASAALSVVNRDTNTTVTASTTANIPSLTVTAKDAGGNTVTTYAQMVHFTSSDAQAVLPSAELDKLRRAIIDLAACHSDLDSGSLRNHLAAMGFAKVVETVLTRTKEISVAYAKADRAAAAAKRSGQR